MTTPETSASIVEVLPENQQETIVYEALELNIQEAGRLGENINIGEFSKFFHPLLKKTYQTCLDQGVTHNVFKAVVIDCLQTIGRLPNTFYDTAPVNAITEKPITEATGHSPYKENTTRARTVETLEAWIDGVLPQSPSENMARDVASSVYCKLGSRPEHWGPKPFGLGPR